MFADTQILEFSKILALLRPYAETDLGKKTVLSLTPSSDPREVNRLLEEVQEAKGMIERYDSAPMTGVLDLSEAFQRARVGSTLSIEELQRITGLVVAVAENQRFIRKIRQLEIACSVLAPFFDDLIAIPHLKTEIDRCIDPKGTVYDDASEELSQIRGKIRINQKRITDRMESLLRSESAKLTDTIITLRNNRLVLPVKSEYKNVFKGIIHDQSASRETVFIEPQSCVEWNSELQNLSFLEQAAIERILAKLTALVQENLTPLMTDFTLLTDLDVIFAKAKFAIATRSVKPTLTENEILLVNARHPLIPTETVVANTIRFCDYRTIIITGPNTGGKTVALKTLGLLSLMVQSGLLIPVDEWSKTIVFSHIFADIGDEQSIEQSLSTFSSHISKIITILDRLEDRSLVLLDELGVGTDPKEGASLAIAILDALRKRDVYAMVTTHYPELKVYAFDKDDVVNASVEFDIDTLRPTYHLQIGTPGTSNALAIAARLGLSPEIVEQAKTVSLSFDDATAEIIRKLERQSLELQREIEEHRQAKIRLQEQNEAMELTLAETRLAQNKAFAEMEKAKIALLESAKEEAQALIRELDELKKSASFKEHELARLKFDVKNLGSQTLERKKVHPRVIQPGDTVTVIPYQKTGIVTKKLPDGKWEVQMGILSAKFDESQLDFIKADVPEPLKGKVTLTRTSEAKLDLDLRGCRFEEAMSMLDKFVDDCLMNNLEFACVIHGYGTGALRKGVQDYIKKNKAIVNSRPGGMNEGGSGVTILYFK